MRVYVNLIRDTLVELKAAGRLRDVNPTVATFSLLGMILWLPRWFRQGGRLSQDAVATELARFALGGLLTPTAPRRRSSPFRADAPHEVERRSRFGVAEARRVAVHVCGDAVMDHREISPSLPP